MATLSIQLRLGLSRGWRVRSLIKAKFYAQSVVHCLFIFSVLRARGFTERIWTLNYSVFASMNKYTIFVEYFKLPAYAFWLRPTRRDYVVRLYKTVNGSVTYKKGRPNCSYINTPYPTVWRKVATSFRRSTGHLEKVESLFWSWDHKQMLINFIAVRAKLHTLNKAAPIPLFSRYAVDYSKFNFKP